MSPALPPYAAAVAYRPDAAADAQARHWILALLLAAALLPLTQVKPAAPGPSLTVNTPTNHE